MTDEHDVSNTFVGSRDVFAAHYRGPIQESPENDLARLGLAHVLLHQSEFAETAKMTSTVQPEKGDGLRKWLISTG